MMRRVKRLTWVKRLISESRASRAACSMAVASQAWSFASSAAASAPPPPSPSPPAGVSPGMGGAAPAGAGFPVGSAKLARLKNKSKHSP